MNHNIYPLAYSLPAGQSCKLYFLGFPTEWKSDLLDIARQSNPKFKADHSLPTEALKKLIDSWMENVIGMTPLKRDSCDACWLTSCHPYSAQDIRNLCDLIRVWITATYKSPRTPVYVRSLAEALCARIDPADLMALQTAAEVCLTLPDGTVSGEGYTALPLLVIDRLAGKEIDLHGQHLHLCRTDKKQLISQPIADPQSRHLYSFVFDFSVQTTPPERKALLLCQIHTRRWISDSAKVRTPFLTEKIHAHIRISPDRYCRIPIEYTRGSGQVDWKREDRICYNIWSYEPLPAAEEVLKAPAAHTDRILLPYKNGMAGFEESAIGTGVSVVDKASLHRSILTLLDGMAEMPLQAARISRRNQTFSVFGSPQEYESPEDFRYWVQKCTGTDQLVFEIYGLWKDPAQQELLQQIQAKIEQDFGSEHEGSCLKITCLPKEVGTLGDALPDDSKETRMARSREMAEMLGETSAVTACILVIPRRRENGDPKQVLRNAFARTGRLVQFVNPEKKIDRHKIEYAVYDLYRQLGVVTLLDFKKAQPPLAGIPCIGMHVCTQVKGISNKRCFLPIYVTVDVLNGKTRVHCDAFSRRTVSYREACLEMAQLYWERDLEQRCFDASRTPARQMLIRLKNRHYTKEDGVMLVIASDKYTRELWNGISDKEIGEYTLTELYCPEQINAGTSKNPYLLSLIDSGVRIVRIRCNEEVPDYYTGLSRKATEEHLQLSAASGIFRYEDVYWGIHEKPNDGQYTRSLIDSRVDHPTRRFAEKDMIELYPLQLQPGDNADHWIFYTHALRQIPIQYSQSTILPLPLHLAKALEEYLFTGS